MYAMMGPAIQRFNTQKHPAAAALAAHWALARSHAVAHCVEYTTLSS